MLMNTSPTKLNLADFIRHHARLTPDNEAVVWGDVRMTYAELEKRSNMVANALVSMGIGPGDKVALNCPNLPYFPVVYYGIMKTGAAVVPLCVLFKPREIAYHLADSDAKAVIVFEGTPELPMGEYTKEAFDQVDSCTDLIVITKDPTAQSPFEGHKTLAQIMFPQLEQFEIYPSDP